MTDNEMSMTLLGSLFSSCICAANVTTIQLKKKERGKMYENDGTIYKDASKSVPQTN
jgi:hypothetical protein